MLFPLVSIIKRNSPASHTCRAVFMFFSDSDFRLNGFSNKFLSLVLDPAWLNA